MPFGYDLSIDRFFPSRARSGFIDSADPAASRAHEGDRMLHRQAGRPTAKGPSRGRDGVVTRASEDVFDISESEDEEPSFNPKKTHNRHQGQEKDLGLAIKQLQESLATKDAELKKSKEDLVKCRHELKAFQQDRAFHSVDKRAGLRSHNSSDASNQALTQLQRSYQENQAMLKESRSEVRHLQKVIQIDQDSKGKLLQAQHKIKTLESALGKCKLEILSMQPPQPMTDAQVKGAYEAFCKFVVDWVDEQVDDAEHFFSAISQIQLNEMAENALEYTAADQPLVQIYEHYPDLENHLVYLVVFGILHNLIFGTGEHFLNLPWQVEEFLEALESGTRKLQLKPGEAGCRTWTCQCFKALLEVDDFQELAKERRDDTATVIEDVLRPLLQNRDGNGFKPGAAIDLVDEAVKLFNMLKSLPHSYYMPMGGRAGTEIFLSFDELDEFKVINAATAGRLRPRERAEARQNGAIVQKLALISPGLVRQGEERGENLVLTEPTILVYFCPGSLATGSEIGRSRDPSVGHNVQVSESVVYQSGDVRGLKREADEMADIQLEADMVREAKRKLTESQREQPEARPTMRNIKQEPDAMQGVRSMIDQESP